jgi:NADPH:quinone reductase-like Zn-dependent oxidoreductase
MSMIQAIVVDPGVVGRLALAQVDPPKPEASQAVVRVAAISLNRGEVRNAQTAQPGARPGWDLAGIVEQPAADGSGPHEGERVVGTVRSGAWAELVAVPTRALAALPAGVSFEQAATLPIAGLTALWAVQKGGDLRGKTTLVTGASGGVGHMLIQLLRMGGARVVGLIRQPAHAAIVREAGADEVVASEDGQAAQAFSPYAFIADAVGGPVLANTLSMLAPDGLCVTYGIGSSAEATINTPAFYRVGGASLYGFYVFHEMTKRPASGGLSQLAGMVADGSLRLHIEVEEPWTEIGPVAQRLIDRGFSGKAVLRVNH